MPPSGDGVMVKSLSRPKVGVGAVVSLADLLKIGEPIRQQGPGKSLDDNPLAQLAFYTILTKGPDSAVIGATKQFAYVEDALNVRIEKNGEKVQAAWRWPKDSTIAVVAWRSDTYPNGPDDSVAEKKPIARAEYDRDGRATLPLIRDCYITVYPGIKTEDEEVFACGESSSSRNFYSAVPQISISYSVRRPRFGGWRLTFRSNGQVPSCDLTNLVVVTKESAVPIDASDGQATPLPTITILQGKEASVKFPPVPKGSYFTLCFSDPSHYQRFLLNHPPAKELKVD
jgi:hypothetical protein